MDGQTVLDLNVPIVDLAVCSLFQLLVGISLAYLLIKTIDKRYFSHQWKALMDLRASLWYDSSKSPCNVIGLTGN